MSRSSAYSGRRELNESPKRRFDDVNRQRTDNPQRRNSLWFSFQLLFRILFAVWFRYRARGVENVPKAGGALLVINHQSFLDPFLVGLPLERPVCYLARENLFRVPVVGWVLRHAYVIPVSRESPSSSSIRSAVRRLRDGYLVGVFPEGTRTRDGSVAEFHPGFLALVRRGNVPVLPVGIAGGWQAMPRGSRWVRRSKIRVVFGRSPGLQLHNKPTGRERQDELVVQTRRQVSECHEQAEHWRLESPKR